MYHLPLLFSTFSPHERVHMRHSPVPWFDYVQITLHMPVSVHNVPLPVELHTTYEISTKCTCAVYTCKGNIENFLRCKNSLLLFVQWYPCSLCTVNIYTYYIFNQQHFNCFSYFSLLYHLTYAYLYSFLQLSFYLLFFLSKRSESHLL